MSIIDKVIAAVTPPESEETRLKARAKARASAGATGSHGVLTITIPKQAKAQPRRIQIGS